MSFKGHNLSLIIWKFAFVTEEEIIERLAIIRENIRVTRESRNILRKQLDEKLDLEPGASSKLERGETKDISVKRLLLLSEIFDVDIRKFFNGIEVVNDDGVSYKKAVLGEQDLINIRLIIKEYFDSQQRQE